jgi:hypothetical protein
MHEIRFTLRERCYCLQREILLLDERLDRQKPGPVQNVLLKKLEHTIFRHNLVLAALIRNDRKPLKNRN